MAQYRRIAMGSNDFLRVSLVDRLLWTLYIMYICSSTLHLLLCYNRKLAPDYR